MDAGNPTLHVSHRERKLFPISLSDRDASPLRFLSGDKSSMGNSERVPTPGK